jgi:hypothetical protein
VLLDIGNNDILDSGVGSIGGVAMGLWGKLVFLGGRGGVVPAALVGLSIVFTASSPSAVALASSSVASSSTPVEWRSSSVVIVAAHGEIRLPVSVSDSCDTSLCSGSMSICRFESAVDSVGSRLIRYVDRSSHSFFFQ